MNNEFLKEKIQNTYPSAYDKIISNLITKKNTFRVNTLKACKEEILKYLEEHRINFAELKEVPNSFTIEDLSSLRNSPLYEEGKIYFQNISSQLPPYVVNPQANEMILDMAAAPGGKTTEMASLAHNTCLITALEKNKIRYERLCYNINLQGAKKVTTLNLDARQLDEMFQFDKILLDAPCSGSGTLTEKNISAYNEELLLRCIKTQSALLKKAMQLIKVNGEIIYSTCSIFKEENEEILKKCLNDNFTIVPLNLDETILKNIPTLPSTIPNVLTICPTELYEGFFIAKIKRTK